MKKLLLLSLLLLMINFLQAQWIQQDPGYLNGIEKLNDIFFIDQNHGWVVGEYSQYYNDVTCLITTNGGMDWEESWSFMNANANTVFFADENNGWWLKLDTPY